MACEPDDITATLNIYVIKSAQPWVEPGAARFLSPVLIFLGLRCGKWAGLSSYGRGAGSSRLLWWEGT